MKVVEIMTQHPKSIRASATIEQALNELYESEFRHLPVVEDEGVLLGMMSERDLAGYKVALEYQIADKASVGRLLEQKIADVIQGDIVVVYPDTEVAELIDLMLDQRVGAVAVVEAEGARLVGVVSYVDILRAVTDLV